MIVCMIAPAPRRRKPLLLARVSGRGYRQLMRERDREVLHEILEARGEFGHREHLELAWSYLRMYDNHEATEVMVGAIRRVARLHQAEDMYHETITRAWLHLTFASCRRSCSSWVFALAKRGTAGLPKYRVLCLGGVSRGSAGAFG